MNKNCVSKDLTLKEAITVIDQLENKLLIVIDEDHVVLGTVTDGDIRRSILKGIGRDDSIQEVMNATPILLHKDDSVEQMISKMEEELIIYVPLVDCNNSFIDLVSLESLKSGLYDDTAVFILAGGLGSRLKDLTKDTPKPMLPINGKPMLERLIESFKEQGFKRFFLSVNYLKEMIMDYFGDGSKWGIDIVYVIEDKRLGTAGPLSLLNKMNCQFNHLIVINADVCVTTNFKSLLQYHTNRRNQMTIVAKEYTYKIPYGVIEFTDEVFDSISEKPSLTYFINAGIYVINKQLIQHLSYDDHLDMNKFIDQIKEAEKRVGVYPLYEDWIDVGAVNDYHHANRHLD